MFGRLALRAGSQLGRQLLRPQCDSPNVILYLCKRTARYFVGQSVRQYHQLPGVAGSSMGVLQCSNIMQAASQCGPSSVLPKANSQLTRHFHAKGSKVRYLDFRYKFRRNYYKCHLLVIRRQKMKKHKRRKWRKKFKSLLAKKRLKREIAKEKAFRVELLTMIKRAEQFDPREYALRKIKDSSGLKKELSREVRFEQLKELIRANRYQVTYIKPKHKRIETIEDYR